MTRSKQDFADAVKLWERGILSEPSYPGNYYNAAKFYYFSADKVWGILYGEVFINLESYTARTTEIQTQLVDGYKKLFTDADIMKNQQNRTEFATAVLDVMKQHSGVVSSGISVPSLEKLRRDFIADWYQRFPSRFSYRLFEYHKQLIAAGMFEAYNQWVFSQANPAQYNTWVAEHKQEADQFSAFQRNRVFKIPKGQYYQALPK